MHVCFRRRGPNTWHKAAHPDVPGAYRRPGGLSRDLTEKIPLFANPYPGHSNPETPQPRARARAPTSPGSSPGCPSPRIWSTMIMPSYAPTPTWHAYNAADVHEHYYNDVTRTLLLINFHTLWVEQLTPACTLGLRLSTGTCTSISSRPCSAAESHGVHVATLTPL